MAHWLLRSPKRLATAAICLLCGTLLGLGIYTFSYAKGGSYFSNDPKGCVNCHVMNEQYDGWQKASHHAVATCNDCHIPHDFFGKYLTKAESGFHHSRAFTFQDFHEPIQISEKSARIVQANCLFCHGDLVDTIAGHGSDDRRSLRCAHCHAAVGHGPTR